MAQKKGYDAVVEANKQAKAELSALLSRDSKSVFFQQQQQQAPEAQPVAAGASAEPKADS